MRQRLRALRCAEENLNNAADLLPSYFDFLHSIVQHGSNCCINLRGGEPSDSATSPAASAAAAAPIVVPSDSGSSVDSSGSYTTEDARRFHRELREAHDCYSEATRENRQLHISLEAQCAALAAADDELADMRAHLSKGDTMVAGKDLL